MSESSRTWNQRARGQNGAVIKGLALRLSLPDVGAVVRSLLGVLIAAAAGLRWGSAGAATAAAGAAAIAGATALQDSPRGRLPLVLAVTAQMGLAVLLGTSASAYTILYVAVVAAWCFGAGLQWAVSANAGLVAAAAGALLVTAPPIEPTVSSVATGDRSRASRRPRAGGAGRLVAAAQMAGAARSVGARLRFAR